jgi:alkenylglycerophosphocholine/alkenylglycerophosphoethanolamine hydrolase
MAILKMKETCVKPVVFAVTALFLVGTAIFFSPLEIPHKLCIPMGIIVLSSFWLTPWEITLALLFSIIGDYAGSCHNFMAQMGSFAVAHIFYVVFFIRRFIRKDYKLTTKMKGYLLMLGICTAALLSFVFVKIVPSAPAGVLRIGVGIYAILICTMLYTALMQRSSLYALGAVLFVVSDFILAWNKFVEPVPYRTILVIGTYLSAQWLLFVRATPYRVPHPVHLLRF